MMTIETHCRKRPALYPMPIPVDEICVESCNSMVVIFFSGGIGGVTSGDEDKRAVVSSASATGPLRESSGGSSSRGVDRRSGVASGV